MKEKKLEYHNLIIKFFDGEISDSEMILLKSLLELDHENRRIFDEENELWQAVSEQVKLNHYNIDTGWMNISSLLGLGGKSSRSITVLRKINFRILITAATIACLIAIGALGLSTVEKAHIFLADSTEITLNSGSSLQYNGQYNIKDRKVKFKGEAFFNVRTNPEKPFVVQLDHMSVSATGTRFNIFSFSNEDRVETTLEEGAITVSIKGSEPVKVKSGQQVIYFVKSKEVLVKDVVTDTYTSWRLNKLRFNDTPFEEVLRRIARKYNVRFEISNRDLLNLKYTATFIDEPIEEVMQMLKTVSPITYKIYYLSSVNDKKYLKPRIVVGKRKPV
jgi:transmembrane sensor